MSKRWTPMSKDADVHEILAQAHRGDSAAFVRFATGWWTPVYRIAWNMLGSASEAAVATEQTLLLVVRFPESVGCTFPFGISLRGAAIDVSLLRCPPTRRSPAESLAVFILREIELCSVEETVAILLIPADEVRARTHRATVLLTGLLGRMRRIPAGSQPSWKA